MPFQLSVTNLKEPEREREEYRGRAEFNAPLSWHGTSVIPATRFVVTTLRNKAS